MAGHAEGRLSPLTILAFASSAIPSAAMLLMIGVYMPRFYAGHVGVSLIAVSAALTLVRLIDIAFDPFIGSVMDRTKTPIGRYRPWMIIGAPILMASIYMLFSPPDGADRNYLILWLLIFYAGLSIFTLAHAAWAGALATAYHERSRIYGWIQGVGVVGSVGLLLLPLLTQGALDPGRAASMPTIALIIVAALPLTTLIISFFAPERVAPDAEKEKPKLKDYLSMIGRPEMRRIIAADLLLALGPGTTGPIYIFFFHDAKGFPVPTVSVLLIFYIGAGLVGAPVWAAIARRFGKHRTIQIACVAYAILQTILMAIPKGLFIETAIGMFAVGFCASAFLLLIRAMVADVADDVRLEQGTERMGLLYAMVTSTQKVGAALSVSIIFPILQFVGYDASEHAVNTQQAIFGLEMCYLFAPIILVLVGGAVLIGYKLDHQRHSEIRAALDARDAANKPATAAEPTGAVPRPM